MNSLAALILAASVVTPPQPTSSIPNTETGAPKFEAGQLSTPLSGDLTTAVRAWALSRREHYGLSPAATLKSSGEFGTRFGASFHLQETVKDLEVYEAKLVVTLDAQRRVEQVSSSLQPFVRVLDGAPMTTGEAMKLAAKELPLVAMRDDGIPYGGAKAFYFRVGDDLHRGFVANVQTLDATKNWYVAIDAVTGERLFVQNRVHRAALDARVYPISPGGLDAGVGVTPTVVRELRHADGGSMIGDVCVSAAADGGFVESQNDGGQLCGTQLMMYNCCPNEGCAANGSAKRASGTLDYMGFPVKYDVAVCDRLRRASNVTNASGDFVYAPVDPPTNRTAVVASDLANSDEFAEVHSFYHVNTIYDWTRGLSGAAQPIFAGNPNIQPFKMRDERRTPAVRPAVWANAMFPNFNEILANPTCAFTPQGCVANTLLRMDNAAFFPRENFAQLPLPGFDTGADTLMIFQGNSADAAYDATVIQHEFGHGAIYATAALTFEDLAIDARSANNEGGALHEGIADYFAAAFNNVPQVGPYFGPRAAAAQPSAPGVPVDGYLRSLDNQNKCPEVLWGEVHQDGMHVAEAMWQARTTVFAGTDNGHTFDAAVYAMLVSITPNADFALVTAALAARVATAFPANPMAAAQLNEIFSQRGVINCSKVLDATAANLPRPYFGTGQSQTFRTSAVPGPMQFKVAGTAGVLRVRVTANVPPDQTGRPASTPMVALTRTGSPVTFTRSGNTLSNDSTRSTAFAGTGNVTATIDVQAPCGTDVYIALAAPGGGAVIQNVNVIAEPLVNCMVPVADAGTGGGTGTGGGSGAGGGTGMTEVLPGVGTGSTTVQPAAKTGCGCSSPADFASPVLGLLTLVGLRRRRRN